MQQVTISAVIPVFNAQQTLRRAVDSLLNQTWLPVEIILVDNNSTDGSPAIMEEYRRRYPDLISIIHQPVPGANAARNAGLYHAGGEWIQFLDADDELMPEKIKHQAELLSIHPEADLIVAPARAISGIDGTFLKEIRVVENVFTGLCYSQLGSTISNLWRRKTLLGCGGWDESRTSSQEYFMMLSLVEKDCVFVTDHGTNVLIYEYPESVSKSFDVDQDLRIVTNRLDYFELLIGFLKEKNQHRFLLYVERMKRINFYAHLIQFGDFTSPDVAAIRHKYRIPFRFWDILTTYCHRTYALHVPDKSSLLKYPKFVVAFFSHLGRLIQTIRFLKST